MTTMAEKVAWLDQAINERMRADWPDYDQSDHVDKHFYRGVSGDWTCEAKRIRDGKTARMVYDETLVT